MNNEQQRIAIAEWMGWSEVENRNGWLFGRPLPSSCMVELPNYPNDLNAMHEAEKKLTGAQCLKYAEELNRATKCFKHITPLVMCMATAAQRSEALCRTLWPERFV